MAATVGAERHEAASVIARIHNLVRVAIVIQAVSNAILENVQNPDHRYPFATVFNRKCSVPRVGSQVSNCTGPLKQRNENAPMPSSGTKDHCVRRRPKRGDVVACKGRRSRRTENARMREHTQYTAQHNIGETERFWRTAERLHIRVDSLVPGSILSHGIHQHVDVEENQASEARGTRTLAPLRWHGPSRSAVVTVSARVSRMLGAPRSRIAHARPGVGRPRRLQTPTPAGVAALSVGIGSSASAADV